MKTAHETALELMERYIRYGLSGTQYNRLVKAVRWQARRYGEGFGVLWSHYHSEATLNIPFSQH